MCVCVCAGQYQLQNLYELCPIFQPVFLCEKLGRIIPEQGRIIIVSWDLKRKILGIFITLASIWERLQKLKFCMKDILIPPFPSACTPIRINLLLAFLLASGGAHIPGPATYQIIGA